MKVAAVFSKLVDVVTGGVGDRVLDVIERQFPGKLSASEQAALQKELALIDNAKAVEANTAIQEAAETLNRRIAEHEGTASEIKDIWVIGPLIILARSMFRPTCSYVTLYIDYQYFKAPKAFPEDAGTLLLVMNFIILGFWFGERTVKNLMPIIMAWLAKR